MIWFTSDLHFGDDRIGLYARDLFFNNNDEFEKEVISNWKYQVNDADTVYVLGDIAFDPESCLKLNQLPGRKILIRGNYDIDGMTAKPGVTECLPKVFEEIYDDLILEVGSISFYLNHFPQKCISDKFNITGHIHGSWRVQRNMINVGIDAWNYFLLDSDHLLFFYNAVTKYYDINVFAGELHCNTDHSR
jgi:calcineurin-like phosphoesterase family protein